MNTEKEKILNLVKAYQNAIHTQNREDFISLWGPDENNTLISLTHPYIGTDTICDEFLIGGLQKVYTQITLVAEDIQIHFVSDDFAIVIFQYHTECIRRETEEEYGIAGIETQVVRKINNTWKLVHIHYSKK